MFLSKYKLITGGLTLLILAIAAQAGLFEVPTAHAIILNLGTGANVHGSLGDDLVKLTSYLAFVNTFMHVILLLILEFLGYFLQSDFFNDPQMMNGLFFIWSLSRDIMNVMFALMLIGVSFYVIITGKTDKAKEHVVNFVVAVILVNFSWFFPRVIIDIANITTATIYSVPNTIMTDTPCMSLEVGGPQPCRVITEAIIFPEDAQVAACLQDPKCSCTKGLECHKTEDFATARGSMAPANAMINGMAVSFARIAVLSKIPTGMAPAGAGLSAKDSVMISFQIAISVMLSFGIQLALVLPLIGLMVGLFIRIIILWVTTAFMPFTFIGYVVNGKLGTAVFGFETDIWKEFINAAFLPAVVAIPFSIGFVMLSAVARIPEPTGAFPMTMNLQMIAGVQTWWALLWTVAAVAIIWIGAFKALKRSELVSRFTEKIRGFGEGVFSGLAHAPLLIPLPLPGGSKAGVNLGTLVNAPKIAAGALQFSASGTNRKGFAATLGERFGVGGSDPGDPGLLAEQLRKDKDNADKIVAAIKGLENNPAAGPGRAEHFAKLQEALHIEGGAGAVPESVILEKLRKVATEKNIPDEISKLRGVIKAIQPAS